jgi:hypothetical protein
VRVSFTGTRYGCTPHQLKELKSWLHYNKASISLAAHGSCMGADVEFHNLVREICGNAVFLAVYPSTASTRRAVEGADFVDHPAPPLVRNKRIVIAGDFLLVAPRTMNEEVRSGTWHAFRFAKGRNMPYKIFWPEPGRND